MNICARNHLGKAAISLLTVLSAVFIGSGCATVYDLPPAIPNYTENKSKFKGNVLVQLKDHTGTPELVKLITDKLREGSCRIYTEKEANSQYFTRPDLILEIQDISLRYRRTAENCSLLDTRLLVFTRVPGNFEKNLLYCGTPRGYQVWVRQETSIYSPFLHSNYSIYHNGQYMSIPKLRSSSPELWNFEVSQVNYDLPKTLSLLTERLFALDSFRKNFLLSKSPLLAKNLSLARKGDANAMLYLFNYNLGDSFHAKNPREAFYWGTHAARRGVRSHLKMMDQLLKELQYTDPVAEAFLLPLLVKYGYPEAQYRTALQIVDPAALDRKLELFKKAALQDHIEAMFVYGSILTTKGPKLDPHEGIKFLEKAAYKGNKMAALRLYNIHREGSIVPINITTSNFWYEKYTGLN